MKAATVGCDGFAPHLNSNLVSEPKPMPELDKIILCGELKANRADSIHCAADALAGQSRANDVTGRRADFKFSQWAGDE